MSTALDPKAKTILKDNISWHYPFPGANTTPWQLEGSIQALRGSGYEDLVCVQNKTVVTNAFKGEDLNRYLPIFSKYNIPVLYNFRDGDMKWIPFKPKAKMLALDKVFPQGIHIPDFFFGKNIVHLPTVKCHIYTTTTGAMKNAFVDPRNAGGPAGDPEGDPLRPVCDHGRDNGRGWSGAAHHAAAREEHYAGQLGPGGH